VGWWTVADGGVGLTGVGGEALVWGGWGSGAAGLFCA